MRESQTGQIATLLRERGQPIDRGRQASGDKLQSLSHQQQIGIIGDIATRGAKMNDAACFRANISIGMHMGHDIVPQLPLVLLSGGEIDVVDVLTKLLDLRRRHIQAQLGLGLGQRPTAVATCETSVRPPEAAHFRRSVAVGQWVLVEIVHQGECLMSNDECLMTNV